MRRCIIRPERHHVSDSTSASNASATTTRNFPFFSFEVERPPPATGMNYYTVLKLSTKVLCQQKLIGTFVFLRHHAPRKVRIVLVRKTEVRYLIRNLLRKCRA